MQDAVQLPRLIRFATFEVDLDSGELRRNGLKLKLSGQPFQILAILLERPGTVVTREELQKRLWPDTFVDFDHNLNSAVNRIREVLGDSAESPRFVETVPKRGYRFIAPVAAPSGRTDQTTVEKPADQETAKPVVFPGGHFRRGSPGGWPDCLLDHSDATAGNAKGSAVHTVNE